jgi:hypothetical protein
VDLYCDEPGCWNKKDWGTNYCMEHINSIYEEAMKRERAYENSQRKTVRVTAILTNPKEVILLEKRVLHRVHTIHTAILIPPGDVYNYDDPDDFADDWAEEFDGGNYDGGYDDAYDYWEENYGN